MHIDSSKTFLRLSVRDVRWLKSLSEHIAFIVPGTQEALCIWNYYCTSIYAPASEPRALLTPSDAKLPSFVSGLCSLLSLEKAMDCWVCRLLLLIFLHLSLYRLSFNSDSKDKR